MPEGEGVGIGQEGEEVWEEAGGEGEEWRCWVGGGGRCASGGDHCLF